MIDSKFIIRYTNGLYTTDVADAPRYSEFRDMFSSGQIKSKEWAVSELKKIDRITDQNIVIAGSWYGTLGLMIKDDFPNVKIKLLDIDPRCKSFLDNILYDVDGVDAFTGDMFEHTYTEQLVINTSCEHIKDVRGWLDKLPVGTLVLLQSNNYNIEDHVSCVSSTAAFRDQTSLSKILYSGKLEMPMYTRYMIIGIV